MKLIWRADKNSFVVRWKEGGKTRERSANTANRREAQEFLGGLKKELELGRVPKTKATGAATMADFRERLKTNHYPTIAYDTRRAYSNALNALERHCRPQLLVDVTKAMLLDFRAKILADGGSKATASSYVNHVRCCLTVGFHEGMIPAVPDWPRQKRGQTGRKMKGFVLTEAEVRRWIKREKNPAIQDALIILALSGFRRKDIATITWSSDDANYIDLDSKPYPTITLTEQKSGKVGVYPMPPMLARYLTKTRPKRKDRVGKLSRIKGTIGQHGKVIAASGRRTKIRRGTKSPMAQDLRRTFGSYWAKRLLPQELQLLMRHESIETTMLFYANIGTGTLAFKMWGK